MLEFPPQALIQAVPVQAPEARELAEESRHPFLEHLPPLCLTATKAQQWYLALKKVLKGLSYLCFFQERRIELPVASSHPGGLCNIQRKQN
ncbi:hypothetical protein GDO81_022289 [Engystomops pustulosus]|uniref:Uncharacterized protein n=1 Tax=Engystomops pustulosus TaxID=76066 RepID=A0AAV6YU23_ENGPU|nr:hypothetical protein GDO81_022289 [Engystomops pustulosus]